jgi:hypothetical protein
LAVRRRPIPPPACADLRRTAPEAPKRRSRRAGPERSGGPAFRRVASKATAAAPSHTCRRGRASRMKETAKWRVAVRRSARPRGGRTPNRPGQLPQLPQSVRVTCGIRSEAAMSRGEWPSSEGRKSALGVNRVPRAARQRASHECAETPWTARSRGNPCRAIARDPTEGFRPEGGDAQKLRPNDGVGTETSRRGWSTWHRHPLYLVRAGARGAHSSVADRHWCRALCHRSKLGIGETRVRLFCRAQAEGLWQLCADERQPI